MCLSHETLVAQISICLNIFVWVEYTGDLLLTEYDRSVTIVTKPRKGLSQPSKSTLP